MTDFLLNSQGLRDGDTITIRNVDVAGVAAFTDLSDTPSGYEDNKYLRSTETGTEWATVSGLGGGGVTVHTDLVGLSEDDHPQYHNDARGDIRYYTQEQVDVLIDNVTVSGIGQTGQYSIADNTQTFSITFDESFLGTDYDVIGSIVNTTDASPAKYGWVITAYTTDGFTVELSDVTDSANYKFNWHAGELFVSGGNIDHGSIQGLADDDHQQYHNDSRGDARYYTQTQINALTTDYVNTAGTNPMLADWDAGDYLIESGGFAVGDARVDYANYSNITGVLYGGELTTYSGNDTYITVASGTGLYVNMDDRESPVVELVSWSQQQYYPSISGIDTKWIGVERTGPGVGEIVSAHQFSQAEKRKKIILGRVWNFSNTDVIEGVGNYKAGAFNAGKTVQDLTYALGSLNISGNVYYPAVSGTMILGRTEGEAFRADANWTSDNTSPNIYSSSTASGIDAYNYHIYGQASDTYSEIHADEYDSLSGEVVTPSGLWTVQRVYYYPVSNVTIVTYGQYLYDTADEARDAATSEDVSLNVDTLQGSILRAFLILRSDCTDLTDTNTAIVVQASSTIAGGISSGGGGGGVTNHGNLTGLGDDDHTQYMLKDGSRGFTDIVSYTTHPTFTSDTEIVDKKYVDDTIDASYVAVYGTFALRNTNSAGQNVTTPSTWIDVQINTTKDASGITLATYAMTLPAGTYMSSGGFYSTSAEPVHSRLYDVTGAAALVEIRTQLIAANTDSYTHIISDTFTLSVQSEVKLQVYSTDANYYIEGGQSTVAGDYIHAQVSFHRIYTT